MAVEVTNTFRELGVNEYRLVVGTASLTDAAATTVSLGSQYIITDVVASVSSKASTEGTTLVAAKKAQATYPGQFDLTKTGASGTTAVTYFVLCK